MKNRTTSEIRTALKGQNMNNPGFEPGDHEK